MASAPGLPAHPLVSSLSCSPALHPACHKLTQDIVLSLPLWPTSAKPPGGVAPAVLPAVSSAPGTPRHSAATGCCLLHLSCYSHFHICGPAGQPWLPHSAERPLGARRLPGWHRSILQPLGEVALAPCPPISCYLAGQARMCHLAGHNPFLHSPPRPRGRK
jgi:hypothetical protein